METVTPKELAVSLQSDSPPALLDVREADEHDFAKIDGSRLVPLRELPDRLHELKGWQEREVVVYCHHGMRSLRAAQFLAAEGFRQVSNLTGGIDRWAVEVDPTVKRY
jgi:adenylyltransferase/sulfurtransferase